MIRTGNNVKAIYAGTFDPITNGHLDIIKRSIHFCHELVIGVGVNSKKTTMFSEMERVKMIGEAVGQTLGPIEEEYGRTFRWSAAPFFGLLVDFAKEQKANILIRGIRSVSDFEYEINLANINKVLAPEIETVFLPTSPELAVVSSSMIKEIAKHGGDVRRFVTKMVEEAVSSKFGFVKYSNSETNYSEMIKRMSGVSGACYPAGLATGPCGSNDMNVKWSKDR